jgi:phage tail-like protein
MLSKVLKNLLPGPVLAYRFNIIITDGHFSPFIRAQSVSGLGMSMDLDKIKTIGGDKELPSDLTYENLVIKRAMIDYGDPLAIDASELLTDLRVKRVDLNIYLTNSFGMYTRSWNIHGAYPIKWSMTEVDASSNAVIMESIEFKYKSLQQISL